MRIRTWIFAALVALVLAANLALVSLRVAQTGEDSVRARVALASTALRAQIELVDARQSPRAVASVPELIEATRPPVDPTLPLGKPDERALRAAASALQPEPDLLAVASSHGAIVSRRTKPAQQLDDAAALPLGKTALEGSSAPVFAQFDKATYRMAAARIPGNAAVAIVGTLIDDRFAAQLRSQVDADVTLLQNGQILASSLPPGDDRARLLRWAAAPGPGFGTLSVRLPLVGTSLSGKLPRGTSRLAVRGALVPLDSGVQAAVTVPASPYFGWLARYQALYIAGLVLFALFSFLWGMLAPRPAPVQAEPTPAPPPRVNTAPSLVGADISDAQAAARPATRDVPWSAGEGPSGEHPVPFPMSPPPPPPEASAAAFIAGQRPRAVESLDPAVEPEEPPPPPAHDPMWASDPFTPTAGQFSSHDAAEPGLVELPQDAIEAPSGLELETREEPELREEPAEREEPLLREAAEEPEEPALREETPAVASTGDLASGSEDDTLPPAPGEDRESSAAKGDFSFAGLLDDVHTAPTPQPAPAMDFETPESTVPGQPTPELIAESRNDSAPSYGGLSAPSPQEYFPGDEPTRIEPVSAALLDKLREKDEEMTLAAERAANPPPPEPEPTPAPAEPPSDANVTMTDFSLPGLADEDPDLAHWQETYDRFRALKEELGEPAGGLTFEKFSAKLRKNREDLMAKHNAKGVRFQVYAKDGKASIKASAIR